jgi:quercetin dioxygenase-like cupin family protein
MSVSRVRGLFAVSFAGEGEEGLALQAVRPERLIAQTSGPIQSGDQTLNRVTTHENSRPAIHGHGLVQRSPDRTSPRAGDGVLADADDRRIRVRQVEYTPGYLADHWYDRGHILLVLEGELESELRDGRKFTLSAGMSYQVSDFGDAAHRSYTPKGAKLFIVD